MTVPGIIEEETTLGIFGPVCDGDLHGVAVDQGSREDEDDARIGALEEELFSDLVVDGLDDDLFGVQLDVVHAFAERSQCDPVLAPEALCIQVEGQTHPVVDEITAATPLDLDRATPDVHLLGIEG